MHVRVVPDGLMQYLTLETSPPRRTFKKNLGQANHFLITIEVGLDAIREGRVNPNSPTWTSWNPRSPLHSADRSSGFAALAALGLVIDGIDAYIADSAARPKLIQEKEARETLVKQDNTTKRFKALIKLCDLEGGIPWALANVARVWRHRLLHRNSNAKLISAVDLALQTNAAEIKDGYSGLDVNTLIAHLKAGDAPRFKETAAMIRGSHQLVQEIDSFWLECLKLETFTCEALDAYLLAGDGAYLSKRISNIWGKDEKTRLRTLRNVLSNTGLTFTEEPDDRCIPAADLLASLVDQKPEAIKARLAGTA